MSVWQKACEAMVGTVSCFHRGLPAIPVEKPPSITPQQHLVDQTALPQSHDTSWTRHAGSAGASSASGQHCKSIARQSDGETRGARSCSLVSTGATIASGDSRGRYRRSECPTQRGRPSAWLPPSNGVLMLPSRATCNSRRRGCHRSIQLAPN